MGTNPKAVLLSFNVVCTALSGELVGLFTGQQMKGKVTTVTLATLPKLLRKSKPPRGEPYCNSARTLNTKRDLLRRMLVTSALLESNEEDIPIRMDMNQISVVNISTSAVHSLR